MYNIEYRRNNPEKIRAHYHKAWKKKTREVREAVLDHYGRECACCGETENVFLTLDHIDGGGAEHRRAIGAGNLYRWLVRFNFPEGFQILCFNCNSAKHLLGECPHRTR